MRLSISLGLAVGLSMSSMTCAQETPFSGPQAGEKLAPFKVQLVSNDHDGDEFDPITECHGGPVIVLFVHEVTRPSVALTRSVVNYANRFRDAGLQSAVVLLTDDPTETRGWVRRARHALPADVPIGISPDGLEGPGAYGLNRKVALTILLGKEDRVTANFALVQPSLAADAPRIGAAIQSLLGKEHQPDLAEMGIEGDPNMQRTDDATFRRFLAPVIKRDASAEQVAAAAHAVESQARDDAAFRQRLGEVAHRIVSAGVIENYGTPPAREYLQKWAKEYGPREIEGAEPQP